MVFYLYAFFTCYLNGCVPLYTHTHTIKNEHDKKNVNENKMCDENKMCTKIVFVLASFFDLVFSKRELREFKPF